MEKATVITAENRSIMDTVLKAAERVGLRTKPVPAPAPTPTPRKPHETIAIPADLNERRALLRRGFQYNPHDGKQAAARRRRQAAVLLEKRGLGLCIACGTTSALTECAVVDEQVICHPCFEKAVAQEQDSEAMPGRTKDGDVAYGVDTEK